MKSGYGRKGKLVCLLFLFTQYCFVPSVSVKIWTPVGKSLLEMKVSGAHCDGILPRLICSRKDPGVSRCSSGQGPEAHLLKSLFWWLTCVHGRAALAEARKGCWVAWIGSDMWSWSAWCGCWDSSLGPLKEYVLFTAEPSLPPPKAFSVDFSFSNEIQLRGRTRQGVRRSRHGCCISSLLLSFTVSVSHPWSSPESPPPF